MTDGMHFSFLLTGAGSLGSLDSAANNGSAQPESGSDEASFGRLFAEQHASGVNKPLTALRQQIAASEKSATAASHHPQLLTQLAADDMAVDISLAGRQLLLNTQAGTVEQAGLQPAQLWLGLLANANDQAKQLDAKTLQAKLMVNLTPGTEPEYRISPPDLGEEALMTDLTDGTEVAANEQPKSELLTKLTSAKLNTDTINSANQAAVAAKTSAAPSVIAAVAGQQRAAENLEDNTAATPAPVTAAANAAKQLQQASVIELTRPEDKPFVDNVKPESDSQEAKVLSNGVAATVAGTAKAAQGDSLVATQLNQAAAQADKADKADTNAVKDTVAAKDVAETKDATAHKLATASLAETSALADSALSAEQLPSDALTPSASAVKPSVANDVNIQSLNSPGAINLVMAATVQAEQASKPLSAAERSVAMQASRMSQSSSRSQDSGQQTERQSARKTLAEALVESKTAGTEAGSAMQNPSGTERQVNVSRLDISLQPAAFLSPASLAASAEVAQSGERILGSALQQTASQLQANQLQSTVQTTIKQQLEQLKQVNLLQQEAAGQLRERVSLMLRQNIQVAEIRLDPAELGQMQIRVNMQQAEATVQFIVQQQHAKELLEQQMPRLREMLQQQGIALGEGQVQQEQGRQASHSGQKTEQQMADEQDDSFSNNSQSLTVQHSDRIVDYYA